MFKMAYKLTKSKCATESILIAEVGDLTPICAAVVRRRAVGGSVNFIVAATGNSCVVTMDGRFVLLRSAYNVYFHPSVCTTRPRLVFFLLKGLSARLGLAHIVGCYSERPVLDSMWS